MAVRKASLRYIREYLSVSQGGAVSEILIFKNFFLILHKLSFLGSYLSDPSGQDVVVEGTTRDFQRHEERLARCRSLGDNRT
ncbi:hypothetical protein V1477_006251 [Vespula maculifrons]|uniref:Uncharacterized protein n=1 Tax=Vespula maculifrons TaxID=7453 RepID=A0ABD2CK61_VESMC